MRCQLADYKFGIQLMKKVELYGLVGAALIIPSKTGVIFTNQVEGYACNHPEVEGFLIPFSNDSGCEDYERSLEYKLCDVFFEGGWGKLIDSQANEIDSILRSSPETKGVSVNMRRLKESVESWVWVNAKEQEFSCYKGFGDFEAILTWPNSD